MNTMDKILVIVGVAVTVFTIVMIALFAVTGSIPDTLCTCFYSLCGGECGIMGIIKSFKVLAIKREWQEEDRKNGVKTNCAVGELDSTTGESDEIIVE